MTIYAIKGFEERINTVYESLQAGEGRFGWSQVETADLRELKRRYEQDGLKTLTEDEKKSYHPFLLEIQPGDYVVYINVPEWGQCTLAEVTGEYYWKFDDDDFNHRFKVNPTSVRTFNRNDAMIPPTLNARLKLQGRWWTIYAEREFNQLLNALQTGTAPAPKTSETNLQHLSNNIGLNLLEITRKISSSHPGKDLEPFVEMVFKNVPGVMSVRPQRGRADHGADLLVDFESGLVSESVPGLVKRETLAVQIKSYEGTHNDPSAINDIERAFEYYEKEKDENVSMGLIVSTADKAGDNLIDESDRLREKSGKPIALLIGAELAMFVLKYAGDLIDLNPTGNV